MEKNKTSTESDNEIEFTKDNKAKASSMIVLLKEDKGNKNGENNLSDDSEEGPTL